MPCGSPTSSANYCSDWRGSRSRGRRDLDSREPEGATSARPAGAHTRRRLRRGVEPPDRHAPYDALMGPTLSWRGVERNAVWRNLIGPGTRVVQTPKEKAAFEAGLVADLRLTASRYPSDRGSPRSSLTSVSRAPDSSSSGIRPVSATPRSSRVTKSSTTVRSVGSRSTATSSSSLATTSGSSCTRPSRGARTPSASRSRSSSAPRISSPDHPTEPSPSPPPTPNHVPGSKIRV